MQVSISHTPEGTNTGRLWFIDAVEGRITGGNVYGESVIKIGVYNVLCTTPVARGGVAG